jgi:hypothetical protein
MATTRHPTTDEGATAAGVAIPEGGTARVIGMRDLQKITAAAIAGLPGATPIQSAGATIALLIPLSPASPEAIAAAVAAVEADRARRTPEERAALEAEFG